MVRNRILDFDHESVFLSGAEVKDMIDYLCTHWGHVGRYIDGLLKNLFNILGVWINWKQIYCLKFPKREQLYWTFYISLRVLDAAIGEKFFLILLYLLGLNQSLYCLYITCFRLRIWCFQKVKRNVTNDVSFVILWIVLNNYVIVLWHILECGLHNCMWIVKFCSLTSHSLMNSLCACQSAIAEALIRWLY